jgi:UDP-N-acetylglucosamine 2-epimerase (non-hydrolysing)
MQTCCASSAKLRGITVAHVEAGLRGFDQSMPEEHDRRGTDQISEFLFVTEPSGAAAARIVDILRAPLRLVAKR